jgi:hypothetical protein
MYLYYISHWNARKIFDVREANRMESVKGEI